MGIDISGSLSIGTGIPKDAWEWGGAIGGAAKEVKMAVHHAKIGNYGRAAEHMMPSGLANIARAYRESEKGVTTEKGRRVWSESGKPLIPTTAESLLRGAGFRSFRQAELSERLYESKEQAAKFTEMRGEIYERYRFYLSQPSDKRDASEYRDIRKDVREYNATVKELGLSKEVPAITYEAMRRQAESTRHATKKDRAMLRQ